MSILLFAFFFMNGIIGQVTTGGVPVPGATVTATQGENRCITITNQRGEYVFPESVSDAWTVRIDMKGFASCNGPASTTSWDLKILPFEEMHAGIVQQEQPVTSATVVPKSGFVKMQADAAKNSGSTEKTSETSSTSGLFDNLSQEDLSQRAMAGSLINGSVHNGADSPFAQPSAFGNNRFFKGLSSGNIGFTLGNSALDAQPYSLTGRSDSTPNYGDYAASVNYGGLMQIPHIYFNRNAVFYFRYEHKQSRNAMTGWGRMPTMAERNGDFSQSIDAFGNKVQLADPNTKMPFAGNVIPKDQISVPAQSLLSLFPLPNSDNPAHANYQTSVLNNSRSDDVSLTVNNSPSNSKNRFSGSFAYSSGRKSSFNLYSFLDRARNSNLSVDLNWLTGIRQKYSLELRFQFRRQGMQFTPHFANRINVSGNAGIAGNNQEPANWGPPNLEFAGGISSLTDGSYARDRNQNSILSYNGSWFNYRHNVTFGAGIQWNQSNLYSQQDAEGTFKFTGNISGYDFADFLLGIPETSSIAYGNADKYFRQRLYHLFLNDNWKIGHGFSINAGIRWEYETPVRELHGRLVNLNISPDFSSIIPMIGNNLINPDKSGIEPRIGLAWRPGISSLVVRAGYGIYRDTNAYDSIAVQMAQQSPLSKSLIAQYDPANPLTMSNVFTTAQPIAFNTFAVDPNFRAGSAQNWQLSIQNNLPAALQLTMMYMGIKGTHLPQEIMPNTFPSGVLSPSGYAYLSSNGNSIRHAGILQLRRRLRSGMAGNFQYTFSKAIDDAPLMGGGRIVNASEGGSAIAQNWLNSRAERALSNFDQRHQVTAQMQYTSGMGLHGGALIDDWKGTLLKDWGLLWELKAGSGSPQTPVYYAPLKGLGVIGNLRPDYTGAPIQSAPAGLHLNPAAFSIPISGQWGNAGRNSIRGPGQFELNVSLGRTFRLRGNSLDVRMDAVNVLNHVTYKSWNTVINSSQFGIPAGVAEMRTMRLFLRYRFGNGNL